MTKVAFAVFAALVAAPALFAAPVENPFAKDKVVLSLSGLDFASVDGQRALAIRMDQAARQVCGDGLSTIHLALAEQSRTCQADVKADIRARIEARTADAGHRGSSVQLASR